MTDADEVRGVIAEWRESMRHAVSDGAGAHSDAQEAIDKIDQAIDDLKNSRIFAIQQLGHLTDLEHQLRRILGVGYVTADLINAQGLLAKTVNMTETHVNTVKYQIQELEKRRNLIQYHFLENLLQETGVILRNVSEIIERLALNL